MRLIKFVTDDCSSPRVGLLQDDQVIELASGPGCLSGLLNADDPEEEVRRLMERTRPPVAVNSVRILAPLDAQEVWGAGVTYERSKVARQEESERGATFYDQVYTASRPELFFKATPSRVVGPGEAIRVRGDSRWSVPEPELAMVLSPALKLVGFTIGNDVSAATSRARTRCICPRPRSTRRVAPWVRASPWSRRCRHARRSASAWRSSATAGRSITARPASRGWLAAWRT